MTTFSYTKPQVGASEDTWGGTLNANWDALGAFLGSLDSADLSKLAAITSSAAELNILDGVTATTAEINKLDGVTATTAQINYVAGVTSPIQAQLDAKYVAVTQDNAAWSDGTSTTDSLVSPAKVKLAVEALAPSVSKYYSNYFLISNGLLKVLAHDLGAVPDFVSVRLQCAVADGDYSAGDVIMLWPDADPDGSVEGTGVRVSASQIIIRIGDNGPGQYVLKNSGGGLNLVASRWLMAVTAVRL